MKMRAGLGLLRRVEVNFRQVPLVLKLECVGWIFMIQHDRIGRLVGQRQLVMILRTREAYLRRQSDLALRAERFEVSIGDVSRESAAFIERLQARELDAADAIEPESAQPPR